MPVPRSRAPVIPLDQEGTVTMLPRYAKLARLYANVFSFCFPSGFRLMAMVALCFLFAGTARASDTTITIGTEDAWYPFSYEERGVSKGYLVELVGKAFAAVGITAHFQALPYTRCMRLTKAGKLLACTNTPPMPAYQDHYLWPQTPILQSNIAIYACQKLAANPASVEELRGSRVLMTHGYPYGDAFDQDKQIEKVTVQREEVVLKQLAAGRGDFGLVNTAAEPMLLAALTPEERSRIRRVTEYPQAPLFVVFSKQWPDAHRFTGLLDKGLALIQKNGQAALLKKQWLENPPPRL